MEGLTFRVEHPKVLVTSGEELDRLLTLMTKLQHTSVSSFFCNRDAFYCFFEDRNVQIWRI